MLMDSNHRSSGITATLRSMYTLVCGLHHPDALPTELNTHFERMCFVNTPSIFLHFHIHPACPWEPNQSKRQPHYCPCCQEMKTEFLNIWLSYPNRYLPRVVQKRSRIVSLRLLSPPRAGFYFVSNKSKSKSSFYTYVHTDKK